MNCTGEFRVARAMCRERERATCLLQGFDDLGYSHEACAVVNYTASTTTCACDIDALKLHDRRRLQDSQENASDCGGSFTTSRETRSSARAAGHRGEREQRVKRVSVLPAWLLPSVGVLVTCLLLVICKERIARLKTNDKYKVVAGRAEDAENALVKVAEGRFEDMENARAEAKQAQALVEVAEGRTEDAENALAEAKQEQVKAEEKTEMLQKKPRQRKRMRRRDRKRWRTGLTRQRQRKTRQEAAQSESKCAGRSRGKGREPPKRT